MKLEIEKNSLLTSKIDVIEAYTRNSIKINIFQGNQAIAIGQSKIGGTPDLPLIIGWPQVKIEIGKQTDNFKNIYPDALLLPDDNVISLPFILQINLSEIKKYDKEKILPEDGILYFFYNDYIYKTDAEPMEDYVSKYYGNDWMEQYKEMLLSSEEIEKIYKERNMQLASIALKQYFKVIYWDGDLSELRKTEFPENLPSKEYKYREVSLSFNNELSYPGGYAIKELSEDERFAYCDILYNSTKNENVCQMLGYPNIGSHDVDINKYLLLEFADCDTKMEKLTGMFFARGIYYFISKNDLINKNFNEVEFDCE